MLIATQAKSSTATLKYFQEVLSRDDYYCGVEVNGRWHGKAALQLGLKPGSLVTKAHFKALLEGRHPLSGKQLVQRLRQDRRPGIDFTFSIPKSATLLWAINGDQRIVEALRESVRETISQDIEPLVCRRVRSGKLAQTKHRQATGNLVYADFLHKSSRPVDGVVDPHLHIHAFVMNSTFDGGQHYAAELEEVLRQMPAMQAKFEARFAHRLQHELGYAITATQYLQSGRRKRGWEIAGIDRTTIEKFSSRTAQIEQRAEEAGILDPHQKGQLGVKTREKKQEGDSVSQLREDWRARLSTSERATFEQLRSGAMGVKNGVDEAQRIAAAVHFALEHHLYRNSTVERHTIVGTALEQGLTLLPEQIEAALAADEILTGVRTIAGARRDYITTPEVLAAERQMIAFARESRGTRLPIARSELVFTRDWLNDQQQAAVRHVLHSKDTVTAITGGAGTGKSSLMVEAVEAMQAHGKGVFVFAPSTGAREVLVEKGFSDAQTVEHLLRNEKLHAKLPDQVLWIDEASLLDVRSMNAVFELAQAHNCRVVLSGDTRQHASPRRGEAMRLLETAAGLHIARVETIQRQQGRYKQAVELISRGQEVVDPKTGLTGMLAGFDLLDQLGKIKEYPATDRHEVLAGAYLEARHSKQSTLVVAPTHAEGQAATEMIRTRLRAAGAIGVAGREFLQLRSLNLSTAQKSLAATYDHDAEQANLVVQFHQNVKGGYTRGERYRIVHDPQGHALLTPLDNAGQPDTPKPLPLNAADHFEVYAQTAVEFSVGDRIRFSLGGKALDRKRQISNGRLDEVAGFDARGNLRLKSGLTVSKHYGHFDLGYVVTSHASQGKDVDHVITAIGRQSLPAVNARQFYVSTSRGRQDVSIYVENKGAVRRAIQNAGLQLSATELLQAEQAHQQRTAHERSRRHRIFVDRVRHWWQTVVAASPTSKVNPPVRKPMGWQSSPGLSRS